MINIYLLNSGGGGNLPSTFVSPVGIDSLSATAPGNLPSITKQGKFQGISSGRGGGGQGAVGIDLCVI